MQASSEVEEGELVVDANSDELLLLTPASSSFIAKEEGLEVAVSPPALPMDISLVRWPTPQRKASETLSEATTYRYPNPGGNFCTGMNIKSEDAIKKRRARKMRFGLQDTPMRLAVEQREARAKRFGTKLVATGGETLKLVDSLPEIPDGEVRLEAVHLNGTDEMSTKDVFSYFRLYSPRNIEWVNDSSCNVVWEDTHSASRALLGLGRQPLALRSQFKSWDPIDIDTSSSQEAADTDSSQNRTADADASQNQTADTDASLNQTDSTDASQNQTAGTDASQNQTADTDASQNQTVESPPNQNESSNGQNQTSALPSQNQTETSTSDPSQDFPDPDGSMETDHTPEQSQGSGGASAHGAGDNAHLLQWRFGESHPKAKQLLLRYATVLDVKKKGAAMRSAYYKKHGRPPMLASSSSEDGAEPELKEDLRSRIEKRKLEERIEPEDNEEEEMAYTTPTEDNPFARLVKQPRPLYSDRPNDSLDVTAMMAESEKQRMLAEVEGGASGRVGLGGDEGDLRRALQRKKKHRNLKLRLGHNPRLVEERQ